MAPRIPKKPLEPNGANEPSSTIDRESPPPAKLRLGCAPLITGICLVALLGKFLPHESRRNQPATPAAVTEARKPQAEAKPVQADLRISKPAPQKAADAPKKPEPPAKSNAPAAKPAAPEASGRAAVMNSPWNGSVRQVERYLKNSLYDAASFEALEWGTVVETKKGYQVRCKYRSKNVLGVYVTQSKTFFLDKSGDVYAVKE